MAGACRVETFWRVCSRDYLEAFEASLQIKHLSGVM